MKLVKNGAAETPTLEQKQFLDELEKYPRISSHWNRVSMALNIDSLEKDILVMSSGEKAIAKFMGDLWLREARFGFNLVEDLADLNDAGKQTVLEWVRLPFYP